MDLKKALELIGAYMNHAMVNENDFLDALEYLVEYVNLNEK